jgi:hypothetical protein
MIRVSYCDGFLLIPQSAHAWVSGQLARAWGGGATGAPQPLEAVVLATTLHDLGWLAMDTQPLLNDNGQPLNFLEPGIDMVEAMYLQAVDKVVAVDPYAGLLVNRHMQLIFEGRVQRGTDAPERTAPTRAHLRLQHGQLVAEINTHPVYKAHLSPATLRHNYRILRTCDLLSLFLCGALSPRTIPDVPTIYCAAMTTVTPERSNSNTLRVPMALFAQQEQTFHITARYIPQTNYDSQAAYATAFGAAEKITLTKTLISA